MGEAVKRGLLRHRSRTGSCRLNPVKHEPRLNRAINVSDFSRGNAGHARFALNPRDSSLAPPILLVHPSGRRRLPLLRSSSSSSSSSTAGRRYFRFSPLSLFCCRGFDFAGYFLFVSRLFRKFRNWIFCVMAPAQAFSGVSDEGKPDVAVKSETRASVDTKDVSGILSVNKGKDSLLCVGTSSAPSKADFNSHEGKLDVVVKSEKRDSVDAQDMSGLMCANNQEDSVFHVGSSTALTKVNEVMIEEVDIIDCTASTVVKTVKDEDQDATEYSSSFGDTFSGSDSELKQDHGDMEMESPFFPLNEDPAAIDGFNRVYK
ncbi:hypothetical protein BHE74_00023678 [Ensete ventricosum]|nr:hypothetical protein BHE74_00023678 [Ensete ventricosum]